MWINVKNCGLLPYNFSSRNKTNKQNSQLTLAVPSEKSCLIRRKKKVKNKWINNNKEINLYLKKKVVRFITHLKNKSNKRQTVKKNTPAKQNNGIYNTYHGLLSQEWIDGRYWSPLWYVMLTKVMNST